MNKEEQDDQRRDAMLLRALKTPPQPRPKRVRSDWTKATTSPKDDKRKD
jgi:hypothetical protein